jgi:Ca2+-binding RTX toxin-like protein
VGSINAPGDLGTLQMGSKPFSNPGASILVSAPGSNIGSTSRELVADNGSTFGGQYSTSQGTSFAAPIVSGIIALMLEANPGLGYRDVQTILAMSATKFDDPNGTDWTVNTAKNWNGGGMHKSHDYGFGKVDARAAVRLAETWYDTSTLGNEQTKTASSGALNVAIPDGASTLSRTLSMAAGLEVETAQVTLELDHQRWGDLIIKLISPTGTESILVNRPGKVPGSSAADTGDATAGTMSFSFNSTHVRGEASGGTWTLQVIDAVTGQTGTLKNWKLDLYGSTADSNDTYVYTNEFATTAGRITLTDANGGSKDIVNASAVSGNSIINLANGSTSTIAGKNLTLNGDIERAYGGDGNDTLTGNTATNVLLGGRGNDTINGGGGEDRVEGGRGNDTITGGTGRDWFVIQKDAGSVDTITDFAPLEPGEKIALVGFENVTDFTQVVVTQEGANTRLGLGGGQSILLLGLAPSQVTEQNFVFVSDAATLELYLNYAGKSLTWGTPGVENQLLSNTLGDLAMYALGGDDVIGSQTTSDLIDGGDGNDTIWGDYPGSSPTPGNDWLEGGAGNDVLYGGAGDDRLVGGSGRDRLLGEAGNDLLIGNTENDYLDGGAGDDTLVMDGDFGTVNGTVFGYYGTRVGGTGADTFRVLANGGGTAGSSLSDGSFSASNLIADFDPNQAGEKIDLRAFSWITSVTDLSIQNLTINSTQFARISVSNGTQALNLNIRGVAPAQLNASHFVFAPAVPGAVNGTSANDVLTGDAGANTINGFAGADAMTGRTGDDTYIVDDAGDTINELPGGGYDSVQTSVSYTLSDNVEALTLTGAGSLNATGNAGRNRLVGNAGMNRLDGGAEADSMMGGAGNDTYVVDNQLDTAFENANEGTDTVESSVSWTLGNNFENLTLTCTANANATGNSASNVLLGNAADNIIDGAQGADVMSGGLGNDTCYVDDVGDTVNEALNAGIDTVYSSGNLTLAANVENGALFGAATTLTGNTLDNTLVGNALANTLSADAGNDVLDGGAGADAMTGGAGDDVYFVDNAADTVTEHFKEGIDTVVTGLTYTLGVNTENLVLTGMGDISGTGNTLDNQISGNSSGNTLTGGAGNDTLDGGAGSDTLVGGTGNDTYFVSDVGDMVTELADEGSDTVISALNYSLDANVENLTLSGFANITGTGNSLANSLRGNIGNNTLMGGAGDDTYFFALGSGQDTVDDNDTTAGNIDTISFATGVAPAAVVASRTGQDLLLKYSASDSVTVKNWFSSSAQKIEQVSYADGTVWNVAQIIALTNKLPTGRVSISGTAIQGQTLTATNTIADADGLGAISYQWRANGTAIAGATASNLILTEAQAGKTITVAASYIDGHGTAEKLISAGKAVPAMIDPASGNVTLTGTGNDNATGDELDNILIGNDGNNILDGLLGADKMSGGLGNDVYVNDNVGDEISENLNAGWDTVQSSITYTLGDNLENLTLTGSNAINGTGNGLDNTLIGNVADNVLDGGAGADRLVGGLGNDVYVVDTEGAWEWVASETLDWLPGDQVVEDTNEGVDTVLSWLNYTLTANVENLNLQGTTATYGAGNELNNVLIGNDANNILDGAAGADTMRGGLGNDTYYVDNAGDDLIEQLNQGADTVYSAVDYKLPDNLENLTLTGATAIRGTGNKLNNVLTGNSLANRLAGGLGNDVYYVQATNDVVEENTDEGIDTVYSYGGYTLSANVENLVIGFGFGKGNDLNNMLTVQYYNYFSNDTLNGGEGADTMSAGYGDDTYYVDNAGDVVIENAGQGTDTVISAIEYTLGANLENLTLAGTAAINGTGNALDNVLIGNNAANKLTGGLGNDTYYVDNIDDTVIEYAGQGTDTVISAISYVLGSEVENLTLTGSASINGTGNDLANVLTGNSAANVLTGGLGDDIYVVDNAGDVVIEESATAGGTDTVQTSLLNYTLAANVENLTQTVYNSATTTMGNELNNVLTVIESVIDAGLYDVDGTYDYITASLAKNHVLDGGAGADIMSAGGGSNTYYVDNVGDVVVDKGIGTATIYSSVSYVIASSVRKMVLTGTAQSATGSANANVLVGNAMDNLIDGGWGADTMTGGLGNDTYVVDDLGDVVSENADEGVDTVKSSIAYTLGVNVENLTLLGSAAIKGTGNTRHNVLDGSANSAANVLTGGLGNDTYILGTGDTIVESADAGTDTVVVSSTYTLATNLENLTLAGSAAINGTGNSLNNVLTGNGGNNTLTGGAGNDTLDGGSGNDILVGGTGNDTYVLGRGFGADTVTENDTTAGNTDVLQFLSGIAADQLWLRKVSNAMEVSIIGTTDKMTLSNWYLGTQYQVEQFKTSDGKTLLNSQVQNLVQAMAGFAPPAAGQTTLAQSYQNALQPTIAANWV